MEGSAMDAYESSLRVENGEEDSIYDESSTEEMDIMIEDMDSDEDYLSSTDDETYDYTLDDEENSEEKYVD
ncbi:hypothetical protein [Staphylococcus canis]|uniref:hypothetical protein n=1 Tax=Staphylococcus canis TaxID=2724942 RepID=UPI003D81B2B8